MGFWSLLLLNKAQQIIENKSTFRKLNDSNNRDSSQRSIKNTNNQRSFNSISKGSFNNLKSMQDLEYYHRNTNRYYSRSFIKKNSRDQRNNGRFINKAIKNKKGTNDMPSTTKSRNFAHNIKNTVSPCNLNKFLMKLPSNPQSTFKQIFGRKNTQQAANATLNKNLNFYRTTSSIENLSNPIAKPQKVSMINKLITTSQNQAKKTMEKYVSKQEFKFKKQIKNLRQQVNNNNKQNKLEDTSKCIVLKPKYDLNGKLSLNMTKKFKPNLLVNKEKQTNNKAKQSEICNINKSAIKETIKSSNILVINECSTIERKQVSNSDANTRISGSEYEK